MFGQLRCLNVLVSECENSPCLVLGARGLAERNLGGGSDAYCSVKFEQQEVITRYVQKSLNPEWNATIAFDVTAPDGELILTVWNRDRLLKDGFMGRCVVQLGPIIRREQLVKKHWFPLQGRPKKKDRISGDICVTLWLEASSKKIGIEDFELLTVIGKGGFGKVVQVRKRDTGRIYAMKIIRKDTVVKKNKVRHTKAEQELLMYLRHPFIVGMKYAFQSDEKLYLVLDYVNGGELFYHLKKQLRFSEDMVRFYSSEIVLALEFLHSHGIIYRDLKPENILIDREGHIVLCDFGLIKTGVGYDNPTTGTFCGTPEYLAPEMLLGEQYGREVDWWSLGTLTYEMLTGLPPFYSENVKEMYENILHSPLQFPAFLSSSVVSLLKGLLERDPRKRLGSGQFGSQRVKDHPFFSSIDFELLGKRLIAPDNKPSVTQGDYDVGNIDQEFKRLLPTDSLVASDARLAKVPEDAFLGFSYNQDDENNPFTSSDPAKRRPSWARFPQDPALTSALSTLTTAVPDRFRTTSPMPRTPPPSSLGRYAGTPSPTPGRQSPLPSPILMTPRKVKASPTKKLLKRVRSFNKKDEKPSK